MPKLRADNLKRLNLTNRQTSPSAFSSGPIDPAGTKDISRPLPPYNAPIRGRGRCAPASDPDGKGSFGGHGTDRSVGVHRRRLGRFVWAAALCRAVAELP